MSLRLTRVARTSALSCALVCATSCATPASSPAHARGARGADGDAPPATPEDSKGRAADGTSARRDDDVRARAERALARWAERERPHVRAFARDGACPPRAPFAIDDDARATLALPRTDARTRAVVRGLADALTAGVCADRAPRAIFTDADTPFLVDDLPVLVVEAGVRGARLLERAREAVPGARADERAAWDALVARAREAEVSVSALLAASAGLSERALSALVGRALDETARALTPPVALLDAPRVLVEGAFAIDPARALSGPLTVDVEASPVATPSALARCVVVGAREVSLQNGAGDTPAGRVAARRARACALLPIVAPAEWPFDPLLADALAELALERAPVDDAQRDAHARSRALTLRARAIAVRVLESGALDDARARDALSSTWGDARAAPVHGAALLLPPIDPARAARAFFAHVVARALDAALTEQLGPSWPDLTVDEVHPALAAALSAILDESWNDGVDVPRAAVSAVHSFSRAASSSSSSRSSSTRASMRIQLPITIAQKPSD